MGKDQELLQAVKTEDLLTVQKLLQRPRPGKATPFHSKLSHSATDGKHQVSLKPFVRGRGVQSTHTGNPED
ncbi:hypothetical protein JOQ06_015386 [Pogonophryne albipinna]|uniref:Uncharacterized protein n=1 Tax=Pogonophryne albipinna TaxID=1090488 RepID=A0AAD6F6C3_9TELE|nr:hypothetical protein JOQ06_015386 [Pogonophryne albipinna]